MKKNLVSICITTFNRELILPKTLKSVLNQSYKNIEIIIVDDCSNDGTRALIKEKLLNIDKKIKYIRHKKNKGLAAARNSAIKIARGEYFTFCDDDDLWKSNFVKKFVQVASKYEGDWCFCCLEKNINYSKNKIKIHLKSEGELKEFIKLGYTPPVAAQFYNLKSLKKVRGYNEKIKTGVDHDLWIRLAKLGFKLKYLMNTLSIPNSNFYNNRMTTNYEHRMSEIKNSLKIWKKDIVKMYGIEFYKKFYDSYIHRIYYQLFIKKLKTFNLIPIIQNIPLKFIFKFCIEILTKKIPKKILSIIYKKKYILIEPGLKINFD